MSATATEVLAAAMTERQLQDAVVEMARALGWRYYHTYDSRRSTAGFPDLVMVRGGRVLFVELKRQDGRLSQAQSDWWMTLEWPHDEGAIELYCWRPADWHSGRVERVLRGEEQMT